MKTVLITGVAGFLGRQTARAFGQKGWRVVGIDDTPEENRPRDFSLNYVRLKLPDLAVDRLLLHEKPDVLIHAAGPASVAQSIANPAADFQASTVVTFEMLDAVRRCVPKCKFLLLSSAAVYGNPKCLPIPETQPVAPLSPYGFHKRQCELLCQEFAKIYELPTVSARIFSAYGPGLRRQVIWDIFERLITRDELQMSGTGRESRDFIHAADVAAGLYLLAEKGSTHGDVYNLSSGTEISIAELAGMAGDTLGKLIPPRFDGVNRPGDPFNWRADLSRIFGLGFRPRVSLEQGLRQVAGWCRTELA